MDIHLFITFQAKPECVAAFAGLLDQVRRELPQAPGCNGVRVFRHHDRPECFTLLETWTSEQAHRAQVERAVASGAWAHIASHLAGDPVSHYATEV